MIAKKQVVAKKRGRAPRGAPPPPPPPPQQVEGRALVGVLGAKPQKNFDIYRQKDARCSNFKFNLNIFEEYFYVHFVIILVGIDATC